MTIKYPLLIAGHEITRETFTGGSLFYPGYHHEIGRAGSLDIAQAIGSARAAERPGLPERLDLLQRAAGAFSYHLQDVEHAVQQTGMPITLLTALFEEIPEILRSVARQAASRFLQIGTGEARFAERIGPGLINLLLPTEGFCYAVTPGNDPRAAAIVAANLGCLGIPFVLRPSIRDAAAPLVVQALMDGGFDPLFCSLVYIDRDDPLASQHHFRLVDASSIVWTFGPPAAIDSTLRYSEGKPRPSLDLSFLEPDLGEDAQALQQQLVATGPDALRHALVFQRERRDHFEGKRVLRHTSGNCATVACGPFDEQTPSWLYASLGYAPVCTATKSVMAVSGQGWISQAADFLAGLKAGDPLDPLTQIGYIDPRCLDYLDELRRKNSLHIIEYGGQRLSPIQARPLLVSSQEQVPDFFAQEIPAYVLAARACADLAEAVEQINASSREAPRLAVSFFDAPKDQLREALLQVRALAALVDQPTTTLLPGFHEGNDYARLLSRSQLLEIAKTKFRLGA